MYKIWKKYGALDYKECILDDAPKFVKLTYKKMTKIKKSETVWFSFISFKSRKHRDQVNARVMKDPFMSTPEFKNEPMPFDMKRTAYAGFKVVVDA